MRLRGVSSVFNVGIKLDAPGDVDEFASPGA